MYKKFNNLLEKYSKIYNINYINLDDVLLNKKTNKIKKNLLIPIQMYLFIYFGNHLYLCL